MNKMIWTALGAVLLSACAEGRIDADGTQLEVMSKTMAPAEGSARAAGTKTFRRSSDERIDLEAGWAGIQVLGLQACPTLASHLLPLVDALIVAAHAHGGHHAAAPSGSVDVVQVADEQQQAFSLVLPAPGRYCAVRLQLIPVEGEEPPAASVRVAPCYYPDSAGIPDPLSSSTPHECWSQSVTTSSAPFSVTLDQPVTLSPAQPSARIVLGLDYARWFDGIDMLHLQAGDAVALQMLQESVMQNLHAQVLLD